MKPAIIVSFRQSFFVPTTFVNQIRDFGEGKLFLQESYNIFLDGKIYIANYIRPGLFDETKLKPEDATFNLADEVMVRNMRIIGANKAKER